METPDPFELTKPSSVAQRIAGGFIAGLRFVGNQLATADLSPHEGRLRGSLIPEKYMHLPDHLPVHDDTI